MNVLRGLMAKHGLDLEDLAKVTGLSYCGIRNKVAGDTEFKLSEAAKVRDHFNSLGENLTLEEIFFAGQSSKADKMVKGVKE